MSHETPEIGETVQASIEKMVYGGDGLARTAHGVVLVDGVLPGEQVSIRLEEPRRGVRRAKLLEVVTASVERVSPPCPYFGRCGGCRYQHAAYERQLELKQQILLECFERVGKFRLDVPLSVVSAEPWHYRNRSRLHVEKKGSEWALGYYELFSHQLCPVDHCPISSPLINEAIGNLAGAPSAACFPEGEADLELFASDESRTMLATAYSAAPPPPDFGDKLKGTVAALVSACWVQEPSGRRITWGNGFLNCSVGKLQYRVSHGSFFQGNRFLHDALIQAVMEDYKGSRALDLYAGVGFFTVPLSRRFEKVVAVEGQDSSAADLIVNVESVNRRVRAYHKTAEKFLAATSHDWDLIVVDPPRSGLTKPVIEHLLRVRAPHVVYVSCDPTTLARDVARLITAPYRIRSVSFVDQFPQTFHIETVVHLERVR